jgi:hypothetical protein
MPKVLILLFSGNFVELFKEVVFLILEVELRVELM